MSAWQAIILGAIQGLTEFIPVSSSGHLIAIPYLLHWNYQGKAFDVAVHMGTLVALVVYYWRDWVSIISSFASHIIKKQPYDKDTTTTASGRLLVPIIVACIPAAIVGKLWDDFIESKLSVWYFVAPALVIFGLLMLVADRLGKRQRDISQMTYTDYIIIGLAQALALFPGVSRSGITITAGLFRNLDRAAAARFSFLLSTPIIFGAGLLALKKLMEEGIPAREWAVFGWGFASAAIFGYIAIHFLINFLRKNSMTAFVVYRILLAIFMVGVFVLKV
ncbi:MAG: undecaprenyl-diphosphatase UppP [Armatimonadota bacterium]|nr:undecaprenyl-diphosphatase UppP [bacterium]